MRFSAITTGLLGLILIGSPGWAQDARQPKQAILSNGGVLHTLLAAPVTGEPYTAMQVHREVRTLANGTTLSHQGHHFVARDSEGRVRVNLRIGRNGPGQPTTDMVFVKDPVAHTMTMWITGPKVSKKVALTIKLPASPGAPPAQPLQSTPSSRPLPIVTTTNLGTDTLQGVSVSVMRTTTIVPIGRVGNDAPITKTKEVWTSPDLQLIMKEQWEDPRTGERTIELKRFSRSEPDPSMFHPPAGYRVKTALETLQEAEKKLAQTQN